MLYKYNDRFPSSTGIYLIGFCGSKRVYIGSACATNGRCDYENGFGIRWRSHLWALKSGRHETKMQNAYNKYGIKNIFFEILEFCNKENRDEKEQFWIDYYDSYHRGYNSADVGEIPKNTAYERAMKKHLSKRKEYQKELIKRAEDLYNKGFTNLEIMNNLGLSKNTVTKYLKESGIINKNNSKKQQVAIYSFNIKTKKIEHFQSIAECILKTKIFSSDIYKALNNNNGFLKNKLLVFSKEKLSIEEFESKVKK